VNNKIIIVFFLIVILCSSEELFPQSKEWIEYCDLRDTARSLYRTQKYDDAKNYYGKMLSLKNKSYEKIDLFWYVCCLTYSGSTLEVESYLLEFVQSFEFEYRYINDLYALLHTQPYWYKIDSIAKINDNTKNYTMIDSLVIMANLDMDVRRGLAQYSINYVDSINEEKLKKLIALYGFPTWKLVGREGARNAWLIAQHGTQDFRKWYFEYYKQAVEEKNADIKYYAYLIDRIRLYEGIPQLFGTQGSRTQLLPVQDVENLNDRRETVLLPPLDLSKITISNHLPEKTKMR